MAITVGDGGGGRLLWRAPFSTEEVNIKTKTPINGNKGLARDRWRIVDEVVAVEGATFLTGDEL